MALEDSFYAMKKNTLRRLNDGLRKKVQVASPKAKEKAIANYYQRLLKEKQVLFSQNTNPGDRYFLIDMFYWIWKEQEGLLNSFVAEYESAKKLLSKTYEGHEYYPKIEKFLNQNDQEIAASMGCLEGYEEVILEISKELEAMRRKCEKKEASGPIKDKTQQYRELFRSEEYFSRVNEKIKMKLLNENNDWKGIESKLQEIPALMKVLKEHGYIEFQSLTKAIDLFCLFFSIQIGDGTKRTRGKAYYKAYSEFTIMFPRFE